ncbi:MAG: hypothetical protein PHH54_04165 [Candidatus Nanoarchaeia archaeon]|nr:hypothetical protein [Candidatus Nanoarchaeia archaeon]MDD5741155.1 hypothetical protein [Candidatus Nanoarchaeia archaeon]
MKITKRAELTSNQLITIIILIISFAIILAFFFILNLHSTIDKETCRNSVITRGALPMGKDAVQLKCKTQDVCLSMGGDCNVQRKDMVTVKVSDESELTKEMVNLLWDCWWMMGEGKVDYMSSGMGFDETYCSICNKIYFDSKIKEKYKDGITYSLIYRYMQSTKIPDKDETYLFSIYKVNSLDSVRNGLLEGKNPVDIYAYKIDPSKEYVSVTAMIKTTSNWEIAGTTIGGLIGTVVGFSVPGSHWVTVPAGISIGSSVGMWLGPADIKYMVPKYLEFNGKELEALNCKEYVSEG